MRSVFLILSFILSVCPGHAQHPDYGDTSFWWSHPEMKDNADYQPGGSICEAQNTAKADVFYIHPTTYYRGTRPNPRWNNQSVERLTKVIMLNQASVFNASCKIYAPKYRQVILRLMLDKKDTSRIRALDTAYSDVRAAFLTYLEKWNNGRPIVIAGHSQGSYLAQRLLQEFFENKPLANQLVAAYIPGYPMAEDVFDNQFRDLGVCTEKDQTGCLLPWQTVSYKMDGDYLRKNILLYIDGDHVFNDGFKLVCVNPLSWDTTSIRVDADDNPGSLAPFMRHQQFEIPEKGICDAQIVNGFVKVSELKDLSFNSTGGNYHIHDYGLFWSSVRENVALRVDAYLKSH